jgi:tripartite-type tricarboxylate transporter receptor subunit TctC
MASFGTGSPSHLAGELFKSTAGVDMIHVPYRGSAGALTDLVSGRVEVMFDTLLASGPHIRSGALRLLAMTGKPSPEAFQHWRRRCRDTKPMAGRGSPHGRAHRGQSSTG